MELKEQSGRVREKERVRADLQRERRHVDMMIMQFYGRNEGIPPPIETVNTTEIEKLKQAVKDKTKEIKNLSNKLKEKEKEVQSSLLQVERQSQHEDDLEDQLVQLTTEVSALRARLEEAEDGRMRAEVELEDLNSRKTFNKPPADPRNCMACGPGLQFGQTSEESKFKVHLKDMYDQPCVERHKVTSELKSLVDGSVTQVKVEPQTTNEASYMAFYQPSIRGRHELSIAVNSAAIINSPFKVYVQQPPQFMDKPVRVIEGLNKPCGAVYSNSGQLVVTDKDSISVFDSQDRLLQRFTCKSLERWYSRVKVYPTGVAVDDGGTIYVSSKEEHRLIKVGPIGKVLKSIGGLGVGNGQFDWPDGIALRRNILYVCDQFNHRIQIFSCDMDLKFISSFGSLGSGEGEFKYPRDITFDQEENMYVVERGNDRVQVFSQNGSFIRLIGKSGSGPGELSRPEGISVKHDIVYITEWNNNRISVFTVMGEFITSFGKQGTEEGMFNNPCGLTVDHDGYLYVCDVHNNRIQVF